MRSYVLFSDIHGNLPALEAILTGGAGSGTERPPPSSRTTSGGEETSPTVE